MWVGSPPGSSATFEGWDSPEVRRPALSTTGSAGRKLRRYQSAQFDANAGAWRCRFCGWTYPGTRPNALQRHEHKKTCPAPPTDQQRLGPGSLIGESGDSTFEGTSDASATGTFCNVSTSDARSHAEDNGEGRNSADLSSEATSSASGGQSGEIYMENEIQDAPAGTFGKQMSSQQEDSTGRNVGDISEDVNTPGPNQSPLKKSAKKDNVSGLSPGARQRESHLGDQSGAESYGIVTAAEDSDVGSIPRVEEKNGKVPSRPTGSIVVDDDVTTLKDTERKTNLKSDGEEKEDVGAGLSATADEKGSESQKPPSLVDQRHHAEQLHPKTGQSERNWDEFVLLGKNEEIVDESSQPPLPEEADRHDYCRSSEEFQTVEKEGGEGIDDEKWELVESYEYRDWVGDSGQMNKVLGKQLSVAETNWEDWDEVVKGGALLV